MDNKVKAIYVSRENRFVNVGHEIDGGAVDISD